MAAYATVKDYRLITADEDTPDEEVRRNLIFAGDKAEELTFGRLAETKLTAFQKKCVKNFVCLQAKHTLENGFEDSGDIAAYTVGSISVTAADKVSEADTLNVSSQALSYLDRSGLRWRGA